MDFIKHLPSSSSIAPTFSEALRIDTPAGNSLGKLGAGMQDVVSIKTYLVDLGPYAVSRADR